MLAEKTIVKAFSKLQENGSKAFKLSCGKAKTIAIVGATGLQGGATLKAFSKLKESGNKSYKVRAITRDPTSEKAKAIIDFVDEVVKADSNDVDSLVKAFNGCYGAFIVTNFWEYMNAETEMKQLRNLKEAVKKAGLEHVVISTLEDTRGIISNAENKDTWVFPKGNDTMYVPHFDGKGEVAQECIDEGLPATYLYTTFYMENFIYTLGPSRQSDKDPYAITIPMGDSKLSMVAVADIGKMACAILQDPKLIGKKIGVESESLTGHEIAEVFTKVTGEKIIYNKIPWNVFASFGFPGADDLANMFRYYDEHSDNFLSLRVVSDNMKKKMDGVYSLEQWLTENKGAIKL